VKNEKTGKTEIVDLGLFPQQRYDGEEFVYGLDISGRLDPEGDGVRLTITTTRYGRWQGRAFSTPMRPWAPSWRLGSIRAWPPPRR
jgi:hypothetical protein